MENKKPIENIICSLANVAFVLIGMLIGMTIIKYDTTTKSKQSPPTPDSAILKELKVIEAKQDSLTLWLTEDFDWKNDIKNR